MFIGVRCAARDVHSFTPGLAPHYQEDHTRDAKVPAGEFGLREGAHRPHAENKMEQGTRLACTGNHAGGSDTPAPVLPRLPLRTRGRLAPARNDARYSTIVSLILPRH